MKLIIQGSLNLPSISQYTYYEAFLRKGAVWEINGIASLSLTCGLIVGIDRHRYRQIRQSGYVRVVAMDEGGR